MCNCAFISIEAALKDFNTLSTEIFCAKAAKTDF